SESACRRREAGSHLPCRRPGPAPTPQRRPPAPPPLGGREAMPAAPLKKGRRRAAPPRRRYRALGTSTGPSAPPPARACPPYGCSMAGRREGAPAGNSCERSGAQARPACPAPGALHRPREVRRGGNEGNGTGTRRKPEEKQGNREQEVRERELPPARVRGSSAQAPRGGARAVRGAAPSPRGGAVAVEIYFPFFF
ncbi:hypothetical protein Nmel_008071, partial [Mimus melanotis]